MKKLLFIVLLIIFTYANATTIQNPTEQNQLVMESMNLQPLAFTENQGQWDENVRFRANAGGATMWFGKYGAYYQFTKRIPTAEATIEAVFGTDDTDFPRDRFSHESDSVESIMIKASFVGANPDPNMVGLEEMEYKCNYFIGNDPNEWYTDIPNYQSVTYEDIYAGIDLKYYGNGKQMEYDFIVSPGADPSQILVQYEGAKSLSVNEFGELVVETDWNRVIERKPYVYQHVNGERLEIEGEYSLTSEITFAFKLSDDYNPTLALVIDPVISYSTYLGGSEYDFGEAIAVDNEESAYVTGITESIDFPTANQYQSFQGGTYDVFVSKISSAGNSLIYSTYLGGNQDDYGNGIAVDSSGNAYITGETESSNFPTENPYQMDQGSTDAFITKLNSDGNELIYSTYLGGVSADGGKDIIVDGNGNAYIAGSTDATDFPTYNSFQALNQGTADVFVTKLSNSGDNLVYSTYLGGSLYDYGYSIAIDEANNAYVTGRTWSSDFPIVNQYQNYQGLYNVFVSKINSSGNGLIYSTYLGGEDNDYGMCIDVDSNGNAYVTGFTWSDNFPLLGSSHAVSTAINSVFITKLNSNGSELIFSTLLGGSGWDEGYAITLDVNGNAYITGYTSSNDFPTVNPYQMNQPYDDIFIAKLSSTGNNLIYSSYLGGNSWDRGVGITIGKTGSTYITGRTYSSDFPIINHFQSNHLKYDAFVLKLIDCLDFDYDQVCDSIDNCDLVFNPYQEDEDLDNIGDSCDTCTDTDNDGYGNIGFIYNECPEDNCLLTYNPDQEDSDQDNIGDSCDVCTDTDGDGFGNYGFPNNTCTDDNCQEIFNPDQEDSDGDLVGDSCDICPNHTDDDCCDPTIDNDPPAITSPSSLIYTPDTDFEYVITSSDLNCDGVELIQIFEDYPSWCNVIGDTLIGSVECNYADTSFMVIVSDGELDDTLEVSLVIDLSNQPPEITDTIASVPIRVARVFSYYPTISDIDDSVHTISYLNYPHWCAIQNDSVIGTAPDTLFLELLKVIVQDYCHADTFSFVVDIFRCGDADGNGAIDISDAVYLIAYIFGGGPAPDPLEAADADCSLAIDVSDAVYLISYIFGGGPAPCEAC